MAITGYCRGCGVLDDLDWGELCGSCRQEWHQECEEDGMLDAPEEAVR